MRAVEMLPVTAPWTTDVAYIVKDDACQLSAIVRLLLSHVTCRTPAEGATATGKIYELLMVGPATPENSWSSASVGPTKLPPYSTM